jgi:hypothetical protein
MKNLPLNEKHLADKLQNVPVPDVDQSWEQMRKLLDREMPEPAAAWSGNRKWWWMGITAAVVMIAAWLTTPFHINEAGSANKEVAGANAPAGNASAEKNNGTVRSNSSSNKNNSSEKNSNKPDANDVNNTGSNDVAGADVSNKKNNGTNADAVSKSKTDFNKTLSAGTNANSAKPETNKDALTTNKPSVINPDVPGKNDVSKTGNSNKPPSVKTAAPGNVPSGNVPSGNTLSGKSNKGKNTGVVTSGAVTSSDIASNRRNSREAATGNKTSKGVPDKTSGQKTSTGKPDGLASKQNTGTQTLNGVTADGRSTTESSNEIEATAINTQLADAEPFTDPGDVFIEMQRQQPSIIAIAGKTDKAFAREVRKKSMKDDNRRLSKASMRGSSRGSDHELTFAAGRALPQSGPVGGQQAAPYNIAAKNSAIITDYIPAPYFQYHLSDRVFLQTEFHFQSPQYTQRLLLGNRVDSFFTRRYESTQHLEKLYYFNIPFNVYYSPVRNVYIGGGLQFSSLIGGVSTYEEKVTDGQTVIRQSSVTSRFKDDSTASAFRPSEWRYQLDANYYFNRFTFGARFNQAMKDFINIQVGPNAAVTQGRNKSFLLFLRYNIWEERKKTN